MSSIEIQKFSGAYVFPGSILIDATGQNVGSIISEPSNNCIVIRTKDVETFDFARKIAVILFYSQMLPPRCGCSKLTKNIPTIDLEKYRELFFLLCKSQPKRKIQTAYESIVNYEIQIREKQQEITELKKHIHTTAYELYC